MSGPWTPDAIETLRTMRGKYSTTLIVAALAVRHGVFVTRNAVIGKAKRLGLPRLTGQPEQHLLRFTPKRRYERTKAQADSDNRIVMRLKRPAKQAKPMPAAIPAPTHEPPSLRLSVAELKPDSCRWIAGDPRVDATHCGQPVKAGKRFCPHHQARAYQSGSQRDFDRMAAAHFGSGRRAA